MSATLSGLGDPSVNQIDEMPCPHGAYILVGERDKKQTNKQKSMMKKGGDKC